jgi:hypothetical protein
MSVIKNVLIGLDQTLNCLIKLDDGWGFPDETLSARAWRLRKEHPWLKAVIDGLFFWDSFHCYESWISEQERRQMPGGY